jgi:hypothetical protein
VAARAQQPAMPVIGYLGAQSADEECKNWTVPFLKGLKETGYVEGQSVAIEPVAAPAPEIKILWPRIVVEQMPGTNRTPVSVSHRMRN